MLEELDHKVTLADGGQQGLEKLRGGTFDLVCTDLAMPEMDGWETARAIRKHWPGVKIILVTGYGLTAVTPPGEEKLVDEIIGKPFNFAQVGLVLNGLFAGKDELEKVLA